MTEKGDLVVQFRKAITHRYNLYNWFAALAGGLCLLILLLLDKEGFASSLTFMACACSIGLLIRNLNHREKMIDYLAQNKNDQFSQLENYLEAKKKQWENNQWLRLILGVVTGLAMLFLLLFHADPYWAKTISSLFIILIPAVAILGWMNFNDQILLHDIRRSHRDQPSNIPE